MDIHEYQAKEILARFGVPIPRGGLAYSPEQASYRCTEIGGSAWVVKAQVHAGGRGAAGGVRLCTSDRAVQDVANSMFGRRLVTSQSGPRGKLIYRVYVEEATDIARELYFSIVLDRRIERVVIIASAEGGVEIQRSGPVSPGRVELRKQCCAWRRSSGRWRDAGLLRCSSCFLSAVRLFEAGSGCWQEQELIETPQDTPCYVLRNVHPHYQRRYKWLPIKPDVAALPYADCD